MGLQLSTVDLSGVSISTITEKYGDKQFKVLTIMWKSPSPKSNRLFPVVPVAILVMSSPALTVDPLSEKDSVPVTDMAELITDSVSRDIASVVVVDLVFA